MKFCVAWSFMLLAVLVSTRPLVDQAVVKSYWLSKDWGSERCEYCEIARFTFGRRSIGFVILILGM